MFLDDFDLLGDDGHGRLLLDSLRAAGVDTVGVLVGGASTGAALSPWLGDALSPRR